MKTKIIKLDPYNPDISELKYAARVLREGGLVAFPTETVYGLGAHALDEKAVRAIFEAKGRPQDNPLIVHIATREALAPLAAHVPPAAGSIMDRFWPGPLTLIMDKSPAIPSAVTAGLSTVAIRMPAHPVALALIREAGVPVAAPSANLSGKPSPTRAEHVIEDLMGRVDVILDAGDSEYGVESTVLDLTVSPPMILRPGGITLEQLSEIVPGVRLDPGLAGKSESAAVPKAPGMKYTHYSPKADVIIIEGSPTKVVARINELVSQYAREGLVAGVLATDQTAGHYHCAHVQSLGDRNSPKTIASNLFRAFREMDALKVSVIFTEAVENTGIGLAVMNRMRKAAGYHIIQAD